MVSALKLLLLDYCLGVEGQFHLMFDRVTT